MNDGVKLLTQISDQIVSDAPKHKEIQTETLTIHNRWYNRRMKLVLEVIEQLSAKDPRLNHFIDEYAKLAADGLQSITEEESYDLAVDVIKDQWETLLTQAKSMDMALFE